MNITFIRGIYDTPTDAEREGVFCVDLNNYNRFFCSRIDKKSKSSCLDFLRTKESDLKTKRSKDGIRFLGQRRMSLSLGQRRMSLNLGTFCVVPKKSLKH